MKLMTAALALAAVWLVRVEWRMQAAKVAVLAAPGQVLERIGRHVVVGYDEPASVRRLVELRAIAGIYITQRNIAGRSVDVLADEVASLQQIRQQQGLAPLIVATDHEGGRVAHLSPPLPSTPPLATIVEQAGENWRDAVLAYAEQHARELKRVGVNLNFAPVVDLRVAGAVVSKRALASDPARVTQIAAAYCAGLARQQVRCTLKHFPGLGSVSQDTHWRTGEVGQTREQLEQADWVPFREIAAEEAMRPAIMVGHTRIAAVDPETPSSVSHPVLTGILRETWGFTGPVITDDLSMLPISLRKGGAELAAVQALNRGADLVLVAYDTRLVYRVLEFLVRAEVAGTLDGHQLAASRGRLARYRL